MSSRRPPTALATSSSERPFPYTSAVSIQSIPQSKIAAMAPWICSSGGAWPHSEPPPASHAPNPTTDISGPCEPSLRVRIPPPDWSDPPPI
jgi:hypothetical protein